MSTGNGQGRASAELTASIRSEIASGRVAAGHFLPTERELSEERGVARKTVRRALQALEAEGLIATVPRRGYRVLAAANDPNRGAPVGYMLATERKPEELTARYRAQLAAFEAAASRRGWSMLMVTAENRTRAQMLEQARVARASGLILDTEDAELVGLVQASGIPTVLVDAWQPDFSLDSVMQDGHQGGLLAAAHLVAKGHRRIAVVVPRIGDAHSTDRFGGAAAGLAAAGLDLPAELRVTVASAAEAPAAVAGLLSGRDRPTGFIVLWSELAGALGGAARAAGLVHGRDYELVGWTPEELYASEYAPRFSGGPVPPAVTWSIAGMAEAALSRLAERRQNPGTAALRVKVPVRLRMNSDG